MLSERQSTNNATIDCGNIYFSNRAYVDKIKNSEIGGSDVNWLYHELRHVEQCAELGGRDSYAERWFRDIEYSILLNLVRFNTGTSMPNIHDWMPMEQNADERATEVQTKPNQNAFHLTRKQSGD